VFATMAHILKIPLADWVTKLSNLSKIVRVGLSPILEPSRWFVGEKPSE